MKLAIDVGNSTICAVLFSPVGPKDPVVLSSQSPQLDRLDPLLASAEKVLIAGVAPSITEKTASCIREKGARVRVITCRDIPLETIGADRNTVGADRLLNGLCAAREYDLPAVIVDSGSAVTVDVVDDSGKFRGGAIFPGLRMLARSLARDAELLRAQGDIRLEEAPMPGRNTTEAVRSGILRGSAGMIQRLVRDAEKFLQTPATVILTGGTSRQMMQLLDGPDPVLDPLLTVKGICHADA